MINTFIILAGFAVAQPDANEPKPADLILHSGKIVTVDDDFSIRQAIAVREGKILAVGDDETILKLKGPNTTVLDLDGKTVLPGLIDSHTHPEGAAMHEFDHPIPDMETIADVLDYIRDRTTKVPEGRWISMRQVFITRLKEQRYPTRAELDKVAPKHPVIFSTGPDASVNSLALELSGIDKDFEVTDGGAGYVEKDPDTGEPTGIIRSCTRYVKNRSSGRSATEAERRGRLRKLFSDYNSVGITGIIDRNASAGSIDRFAALRDEDQLTVRIAASHSLGSGGDIETIRKRVKEIAEKPLTKPNPMVRIVGVKIFLDGGMLTGSAYMREPWGVSDIYSISDPDYKGLLFVSKDRLNAIVRAVAEKGLQFTAHSVGDGAVHTLLEVYSDLSEEMPIRHTRPCLTHSNFMSKEAVEECARLGVVVDIQPAWLYLDTWTLAKQFGYDRLRYFQPLKSLFEAGVVAGGGSDHMQKIGSFRSVNPYNPFLGIETTITRGARWYDRPLHPEEALSREQAIRFYTINNAKLMFLEDQIGSLEPGKFADLTVLDQDILTCPAEKIRETTCERTYLAGKQVYP